MAVRIEEGSVKEGLLGLVLALAEIVVDALRLQAWRRMEGGRLSDAEVEALGRSLLDLDRALAEIEEELGLARAVASVRRGLDRVVEDALLRPLDDGRGVGGCTTCTPR